MIAIDPGWVNIVYAVEKLPNNEFKTFELTRREYYKKTGMNRAKEKCAKWDNQNEAAWNTFHSINPKTTKPNQF